MLEYQERGTEENERTAELYSEQGKTDLIELMMIDETMQCAVCQEHNPKGWPFCKCASILSGLEAEKTKKDDRDN